MVPLHVGKQASCLTNIVTLCGLKKVNAYLRTLSNNILCKQRMLMLQLMHPYRLIEPEAVHKHHGPHTARAWHSLLNLFRTSLIVTQRNTVPAADDAIAADKASPCNNELSDNGGELANMLC